MNPGIDQGIAPILLVPQTLLAPATKEVFVDTASGGTWVNRTLWQVIQTGVHGSAPGGIPRAISIIEHPSPFLIGIVANYPPCGLNASQQVANKRQSASPALVGHTQKLDAVVDGKFPDDMYSASIFIKVTSHKISNGSSGDLYTRCRMNFVADSVQTQTPQIMDMGFSTINALDESSGISNPATIILRPTYGVH